MISVEPVAIGEDLDDLRARPFRRSDLDPNPLRQFADWYRAAQEAGVPFAHAVALATATPEGRPSVRMVLIKDFDESGFSFYTNYGSRKGRELGANPHAALLFYWHPLGRQVRLEGVVEPLPEDESNAYFATRPPGGRLAAMASQQSEPIDTRAALEERFQKLEAQYADGDPARPGHWGGYRLTPERYEFWQHRENRLHDRFLYIPSGGGWQIQRLQP
jgi:pyridoxamine 5'-phosphate oxidase